MEQKFAVWAKNGLYYVIWRGLAKNKRDAKKKAMAAKPWIARVESKSWKADLDFSVPIDQIPKSGPNTGDTP